MHARQVHFCHVIAGAALRLNKKLSCDADAAKKVAGERAVALATARKTTKAIMEEADAKAWSRCQELSAKLRIARAAEDAEAQLLAAASEAAKCARNRASKAHEMAEAFCRDAAWIKALMPGLLQDNDTAAHSPLLAAKILATERSVLLLNDWTSLMFSVLFDPIDSNSALLYVLGADANETSRDGTTPLMVAAIRQRVDVVQLLLERGAKLDAVTVNGWSALMFAASKRSICMVKLLLGADTDVVNRASNRGMTAMMRAACNGRCEIIKLLVECGGNVNAVDCDGKTALMFAAMHAHHDAVVTLIKHGAAIDAVTRDGLTAFHYAAANNCPTELLILPAAETARVLLPEFSNGSEEVVD